MSGISGVNAATAAQKDLVQIVLPVAIAAAALASVYFFVWQMGGVAITADFGWLWRTGQHIAETGSLPAGDIFSWTRPGEPWVLYQWLFELIVATGEEWFGLRGLLALFTLIAVGIYVLAPLYGAVPRRVPPMFVLLPAGLGLAVVSINLSLRPMIVTSAFLLVQYVLIQRLRRGEAGPKATLLLCMVAYALWGNMHTGVTLGLASILLFAAGDLIERLGVYSFRPADPVIEGRPVALSFYLLLIAGGFLASLANPYGFGIYSYIFELSRQSYLNSLIVELQSPSFHETRFVWFLLLVGGLLFFLARPRRHVSAGDLLHLAVFTLATLYSARFVVWAVLFYVLVLPRAIHHEWIAAAKDGAEPVLAREARWGAWLRNGFAIPCLAIPIAFWMAGLGTSNGLWCDRLQPAISAYAAERRPTDRLFNDPVAGSCLIARDPSQRVLIDTRFDFYGSDFARKVTEVSELRPGWRQALESWNIDVVILERQWPLAQALEASGNFVTIFADDRAIALRRVAAQEKRGQP